MDPALLRDPFTLLRVCWPHVSLYKQQEEAVRSVAENDETYMPAGNMLGKDFVSAFIVLWFFLTRHPCRIVTTSAKEDHLRVLWGEMGQFIATSAVPLSPPLVVHHREIRKVVDGEVCPLSYVKGMVASPDSIASMQGHHIAKVGDGVPRTLFVVDEASSVNDEYYTMCSTWANRILVIGNTWPCDNFFFRAVEGRLGTDDRGGDTPRPSGCGFYRKVIHVTADDSPNVRFARVQQKRGIEPTDEMLVPGVLSWADYCKRVDTWDEVTKCVSLYARFWKGAEALMYPPEWLNRAEEADRVRLCQSLPAEAVGIDPAEGGDRTAMAAVNKFGLKELVSRKTPNTAVVPREALAFMLKHGVRPENVVFDRGGGGKQHADVLREKGYRVRTVAFGELLDLPVRRGLYTVDVRSDHREERSVFVNRRAEMYHELRQLLDPVAPGFALPREYTELRRQLAPIPLMHDPEGRLKLPPKRAKNPDSKEVTLVGLIGHSPDEADAVVLAVHGMLRKVMQSVAGVQ